MAHVCALQGPNRVAEPIASSAALASFQQGLVRAVCCVQRTPSRKSLVLLMSPRARLAGHMSPRGPTKGLAQKGHNDFQTERSCDNDFHISNTTANQQEH